MKVDTVLLPILALVSLGFLIHSLLSRYPQVSKSYTYLGDDFPPEVPIAPLGQVELTLEESMRFISKGDDPVETWSRNVPPGLGYLRLGPKRRIFAVAMYHQLHCLFQISYALSHQYGGNAHLHHCLDYIRQNVLCAADPTLEPDDFTQKNFTVERVGLTRVCRDWTAVDDFVVKNHLDWLDYKAAHISNISYSSL